MKKQKILFPIILLLLIFSVVVPFVSAAFVTIAIQDSAASTVGNLKHVDPSNDAGICSRTGNSFVVAQAGYLDFMQIYLTKVGSPTGSLSLEIWGVTGALDSELPNATLYESVSIQTASVTTGAWYTFEFTDTLSMTVGQRYCWFIRQLDGTMDTGNYINIGGWGTDLYSAGNAMFYLNGNWVPSNTESIGFKIYGDDDPYVAPTPTPTASPSPTPFTYQGDIWAALVPYGALILPLILILVVALICARYAGVWGFFAGLNITAILIYAIMGAAYLPLWGIVMLALVDGLLLFGKISGRV